MLQPRHPSVVCKAEDELVGRMGNQTLHLENTKN